MYTSHLSEELKKILGKRADSLMVNCVVVCIILIGSSGFFVAYPIFVFFFKNERVLPMPLPLPFTTAEENFYLNVGHQCFALFIGLLGNYGVEIGIAMVINSLWAASDIIVYNMKQINEKLEKGVDRAACDMQYRNVLAQFQNLDR